MLRFTRSATLALALAAFALPARPVTQPSRPAQEGCKWERFSDADLGLAAWVERCDLGYTKIDFLKVPGALAVHYTDPAGAPDRVVEVFDLLPGEAPEAGLRRLYAARTEPALAKKCVLAPFREHKVPAGVARYAFVPNPAYAKEEAAKNQPGEIPDPACGEWGDVYDSVQYWETHPKSGVQKVLFVRTGQDTPPFDEKTLELLPAKK